MRIVYSDNKITKDMFNKHTIMLCGPTPRTSDVKSWRPEALKILEDLKYDGLVFVPEWSIPASHIDFTEQVEWERTGLCGCTCIAFWVPRKMGEMPALTTNVEFGSYLTKRPSAVIYGRPNWAEHCHYLDWLYKKETNRSHLTDLASLLNICASWRSAD